MEQEFSEFRETNKSLEHDCSQFKDSVSHMCIAGTVLASWCLTTDVIQCEVLTTLLILSS